jgi:hypothetical protein
MINICKSISYNSNHRIRFVEYVMFVDILDMAKNFCSFSVLRCFSCFPKCKASIDEYFHHFSEIFGGFQSQRCFQLYASGFRFLSLFFCTEFVFKVQESKLPALVNAAFFMVNRYNLLIHHIFVSEIFTPHNNPNKQ